MTDKIIGKNKRRPGSLLYTRSDYVFLAIDYLLLIVVFLIIAYPLYYIILGSLDPRLQTKEGLVLLPTQFTLEGFKAVFNYGSIWIGYRNSIIYTVVGTAINLIMTICAAYTLSRKDFVGRNLFMALFVFTMYFSGGLIPSYLLIVNLGLINSLWAIVLPPAISVYNMIVMRTYFSSQIPTELLEAAQIDGCRNMRFLTQIVLPLSKPIIAVVGLFYAVGHWNSFFSALIYLNEAAKQPLQIVLRQILILNQFEAGSLESMDPEMMATLSARADVMKYAVIIVASLPVLMLYPFVQRYFVSGVMIGSVKG